jgi:CheY-like chemotaxis protein
MAEMDGIRFLKAYEQRPGKRPPVMVLSASATADVVDALDFPDVVGVMRKPIKPHALLERIAALAGAG